MTTTALTHSMTEEQLLQAITEAATLHGWLWHHVRRSDKAIQQGHPGFPDLVLARRGKVLFLELKAASRQPTGAQMEWISAINRTDHLAAVIWPNDLNWLLRKLR